MSSSIIQRIGDLPGICFVLRKAASFLVAVTKSGHFFQKYPSVCLEKISFSLDFEVFATNLK